MLALLSIVILDAVVAPAFDDLELQAARTNLVRAERALLAEVDNLRHVAADWAPWDDSYSYVQGENPGFAKSNLQLRVLKDLNLNMMLFYTVTGKLHAGQIQVGDEVYDYDEVGLFGVSSETESLLTTHDSADSEIAGIVQTRRGPMLVTASPITKTSGEGPIVGTVILGRLLTEVAMAQMQERTEVDLSWHGYEDSMLDREGGIPAFPADDTEHFVYQTHAASVDGYALIRDFKGDPILVLKASTPRQITALGGKTVQGALVMLAVAMTVVALAIWLLLRNIVVRPLESLASHIIVVRESGDLTKQLDVGRGDEIGALADEFNNLTGKLLDARNSLLEQSFKAGKADTAAEVLHNIRNAMTPLINGVDRLGMVCSVTKTLKVDQAMRQLEDETCPPERQKKLLQYIDAAFKHVEASHAEGEKELQAVSRQARQVEAIVSDQERHAVGTPLIESLVLYEVLDEATLVIPKLKVPAIEVDMQQHLDQFRIQGHRVGLLQVLGNLILNAYESIQRSQSETGRISLSASRELIGDRPMVRVIVRDTGCGFEPDKRQKIFQRGFSSKSGKTGKPGGLGLHWCANALAAMGGRITAESSGTGQGAQFHVLLPASDGA